VKTARTILGVVFAVVLLVILVVAAERGLLGPPEDGTGPSGLPAASASPAPGADDEDAPGPATPAVPADAEVAYVRYVHDGDTLFLTDDRKVRLLGIDTPEVGEHAECWGDVARDRLRELLPEGTRVRTVADVQPYDRYGRSLLFLFTDDGALVNLDLIRDGYAEAVVLKPNVLWSDELEAAEDAARAERLGIWSHC